MGSVAVRGGEGSEGKNALRKGPGGPAPSQGGEVQMPARCFLVLAPGPQAAPSPHAQAWGQANGVDFTDHTSSHRFPQLACGPVNP